MSENFLKFYKLIKTNQYIIVTDELLCCSKCGKPLDKNVVFIENYFKKQENVKEKYIIFISNILILHPRCVTGSEFAHQKIQNSAIILNKVPDNCEPHFPKSIPLSETENSTFDLDALYERGSVIIDNAPRSSRYESWEGSFIGRDVKEEIAQKDREGGLAMLGYLDELMAAEPVVISEQGIKPVVFDDKIKHESKGEAVKA